MSIEKNISLKQTTDKINNAFDISRLPFRRNLTHEEIHKLTSASSLAFNSDINHQIIEKIMHYCYYVERKITGRAAGNIEDLIIRYLMRYYASLLSTGFEENEFHLEIGVLFGAATIFSYHAVQLAEKDIITTVIDPFEGYYGEELDPTSGLKVNDKTFLANLDSFHIPKAKIEILKGYSSDSNIINACRNRKVLSLLIDGDHSYNGVKNDWINYSPLVVPGGYVLIDDYNNSAWPEINEYVNNELLSNLRGKWEVVLVFGNSLLLRRTAAQEDKDVTDAQRLFQELSENEKRYSEVNALIEKLTKEKAEALTQVELTVEKHNNLKTIIGAIEKGHKTEIETLLASYKGSKETVEKLIKKIENLEITHLAETQKLSGELSEVNALIEKITKEKAEALDQVKVTIEKHNNLKIIIGAIEKGHKTEVETLLASYKGSKEPVEKLIKKIENLEITHLAETQKLSGELSEANALIDKLTQEKTEAHTNAKRLENDIKKKEETINAYQNSYSWKITTPIRWILK